MDFYQSDRFKDLATSKLRSSRLITEIKAKSTKNASICQPIAAKVYLSIEDNDTKDNQRLEHHDPC